jgi:hypothetical protein
MADVTATGRMQRVGSSSCFESKLPSFRRRALVSAAAMSTAAAASSGAEKKDRDESPIFSIEVPTLDGKLTTLADFKGDVMLIVNVASA